jgi:lipopolysaccharide biosynthesis regulator YciM
LNAAENLVREMKARGQSTKGSIAEAFVCISQKKLDAANAKIQEVLTRMPDYVPALLALALSKFVNGKKEDGKNALRQLGGRFYSHEWADELEQGWLLYADFLINVY